MSVGVFGGAFNPPHVGHLICAEEALQCLDLSRVVFVPTGVAPHKVIDPEPGARVRLDLTRLATEEEERFAVSDSEVERDGPSYACETLAALADEFPDEDLFLIVGADQAAALDTWREPQRILELARVGVASRPGVSEDGVTETLARIGGEGRVTRFPIPGVEVSSSMLRERIAAGRSIRYLTPPAVQAAIEQGGLYR